LQNGGPILQSSSWKRFAVLSIVIAMLAIVVLASSVVLYVAFPHRGVEVPHVPWLGETMSRVVNLFPTLQRRGE